METTASTVNDAPVIAPVSNASTAVSRRITSVDVYRGFVMLLMMGEVLSFHRVSAALPDSSFWRFLAFNQEHVEWVGCSLHDLIQPSFSFLVGVAVPYSIAGRLAKGATYNQLLGHTVVRSIILILLGIFLRSINATQTYFTFEDTLTQIGLGYTFLFMLGFAKTRTQVIALICIIVGYWAAFALYPLPGASFDYASAGITANWEHNLHGFAAHWNKNTNLAWAFDKWFLNLFPRKETFTNNEGGYSTLSFIPTLATMILGLLAGKILKSTFANREKIKRFLFIGTVLFALALSVHFTGINPIVKRIWTPAWVLFSGGCCFFLLTFFFSIIDVYKIKKWSFPLMVIGMNSIAAYLIAHMTPSFIESTFYTHLGQHYDQVFGDPYSSLVRGGLILLAEFWILYWMYKKKLFIKV